MEHTNINTVPKQKTVTLSLGEYWNNFLNNKVKEGQYASASEIVREGLRILQAREAKLANLRQALIDGENSGDAGPLDMKEIIKEAKQKAGLNV